MVAGGRLTVRVTQNGYTKVFIEGHLITRHCKGILLRKKVKLCNLRTQWRIKGTKWGSGGYIKGIEGGI